MPDRILFRICPVRCDTPVFQLGLFGECTACAATCSSEPTLRVHQSKVRSFIHSVIPFEMGQMCKKYKRYWLETEITLSGSLIIVLT